MESNNSNNISPQGLDPIRLVLTENGKNFLNRASTWTKFLAIYSFVIGGINLLSGIKGLSNPLIPSPGIYILGVLIGIVSIVLPAIYLYNFSNQARDAATNNDSAQLESSMANLKNYLMTYGIILISIIGLFLLVFVYAAAANPQGFY